MGSTTSARQAFSWALVAILLIAAGFSPPASGRPCSSEALVATFDVAALDLAVLDRATTDPAGRRDRLADSRPWRCAPLSTRTPGQQQAPGLWPYFALHAPRTLAFVRWQAIAEYDARRQLTWRAAVALRDRQPFIVIEAARLRDVSGWTWRGGGIHLRTGGRLEFGFTFAEQEGEVGAEREWQALLRVTATF